MARPKKVVDSNEELVETPTVAENTTLEAPATEEPKSVNLNDMHIAYVVGLSPDGEFVFEVYGKNKGVVELLGIHQHATRKVNAVYDDTQGLGDRLTVEVGKAVAQLHQKVDQVVSVVAPKKPANQL